jgi:hypothetical protein
VYFSSVGGAGNHVALLLVDAGDFGEDDRRIFLFSENSADRCGNLPRSQNRRRHLVQQRLKDMVIGAVNQRNFGRRPAQRLDGCQAAESPADDHDPW